jgi:hypothetical protein
VGTLRLCIVQPLVCAGHGKCALAFDANLTALCECNKGFVPPTCRFGPKRSITEKFKDWVESPGWHTLVFALGICVVLAAVCVACVYVVCGRKHKSFVGGERRPARGCVSPPRRVEPFPLPCLLTATVQRQRRASWLEWARTGSSTRRSWSLTPQRPSVLVASRRSVCRLTHEEWRGERGRGRDREKRGREGERREDLLRKGERHTVLGHHMPSRAACACVAVVQVYRGSYKGHEVAIKVIHSSLLKSEDRCVPTRGPE